MCVCGLIQVLGFFYCQFSGIVFIIIIIIIIIIIVIDLVIFKALMMVKL